MPAVYPSSGRISADEVLTLDAVKSEMGMGTAALREARRHGLKIRYVGKRGYCLGSDLIEFIRTAARTEK
jgi:hypothetical protein